MEAQKGKKNKYGSFASYLAMLRFESFAFMFKPLPVNSTKTKQKHTHTHTHTAHTNHQKIMTSQVHHSYNNFFFFFCFQIPLKIDQRFFFKNYFLFLATLSFRPNNLSFFFLCRIIHFHSQA